MREYKTVIAVAIVVLALTFSLSSWTVEQASGDSDIDVQSGHLADINFPKVSEAPETNIGPTANATADVFSFVAQDLDTNVTVLFLTNTSTQLATVALYKYNLEGNMINGSSVTIDLGPGNMIPICSDEVVSTVGIWRYALHLNFGPTVMYCMVILPPGVVAEGYVAWNGSDNKYDPGDRNDNLVTVPLKLTYVGSIGQ